MLMEGSREICVFFMGMQEVEPDPTRGGFQGNMLLLHGHAGGKVLFKKEPSATPEAVPDL